LITFSSVAIDWNFLYYSLFPARAKKSVGVNKYHIKGELRPFVTSTPTYEPATTSSKRDATGLRLY